MSPVSNVDHKEYLDLALLLNIVYQIHAARSIERTDSSDIAHIMAIFVFCLTQAEGFVSGMAAKMFVIAGPVLVFGLAASVVYGVLLVLFGGA